MSAQVVLVIPVVILLLMLAIQAGLYFHASSIAGAAAAEGAAAASAARIIETGGARPSAQSLSSRLTSRSSAAPRAAVETIFPSWSKKNIAGIELMAKRTAISFFQ